MYLTLHQPEKQGLWPFLLPAIQVCIYARQENDAQQSYFLI